MVMHVQHDVKFFFLKNSKENLPAKYPTGKFPYFISRGKYYSTGSQRTGTGILQSREFPRKFSLPQKIVRV